MSSLLATLSSVYNVLTDKQKLILTMTEMGCPIDRAGKRSFWAAGRRFIFADEGRGELIKVLDYCEDGRISHSARPSAE
jgi:hypothetical protein